MTSVTLPADQAWTFERLDQVMAAHGILPGAVVHIGAHHGEEVPIYRRCGFAAITLVEPDPRNTEVLYARFGGHRDVFIIAAACVALVGTAVGQRTTLHLARRTVWSGLHPHPSATGETIDVQTVAPADVIGAANLLVLDTQGTELALLGWCDLSLIDMIIIETTRRPGDSAADYQATLEHLAGRGFILAEEWIHDASGYTDCVYVRHRAAWHRP